jgi:hypothetical protein
MLPQIFFFTQNLTVKKPETGERINQKCPVRQNQELADQDKGEPHINRIAAVCKDSVRYKFAWAACIYANPKTFSKRDEAPP